eukprot:4253422-Karenia_brevis.AAC.1
MAPFLQTQLSKSQRGFIPGAFLTSNVFDNDAISRIYCNESNKDNIRSGEGALQSGIAAYFDFCSAFPSVAV